NRRQLPTSEKCGSPESFRGLSPDTEVLPTFTLRVAAVSGSETCPSPRSVRDNRSRSRADSENIRAEPMMQLHRSDRRMWERARTCLRCRNLRSLPGAAAFRARSSVASEVLRCRYYVRRFSFFVDARGFPGAARNFHHRDSLQPLLRQSARTRTV